MFEDALRFPFAGEDSARSLLIGGVLVLLSPLVVPLFPLFGYYLRVITAGIDGDETPPAFEEWVELSVEGLKAVVVSFVYFLAPLVFTVVGAFIIGAGALLAQDRALTGVATGIGIVGALFVFASVVSILLAMYVFPAALANMARSGDITDAFALSTVFGVAFSVEYFVAGLLGIAAVILIGIVNTVLTVFTFGLFILLAVFVQFYAQAVFFYLFGRGYAGARGVGRAE
ncbi:MAG: DUF4013 domain-containing protein [Halobacteriales archaeon]|nr:DUF4013 domain-containing protein [Halobacteriales archaeon]